MKKLFGTLALLVTLTGTVQAQCAVADSLLGGTAKEYGSLKMKYDDFSDSTTINSGFFSTHPFNGDPATAMIATMFSGKTHAPTDSGVTILTVEVKKTGEGGIMGGKGNTLTAANSHFADVKEAQFKFDNGTRLRVPLVSNKPTIEAAGAFTPQTLHEKLTFMFSPADRIAFAKGGSGKMRFGDYEMGFDQDQTERDMGNTIRFLTCSAK